MLAIALCGMVIAINVLIANYAASLYYLLACYLFLTTFMMVYVGFSHLQLFFATFVINMLGIISAGNPAAPEDLITRIGCVLVGTVVALIITAIIWPPRSTHLLRQQFVDCLEEMDKLQQQIFSIYLKRDYPERHFYYEKKLNHEQQYLFCVMEKARFLLTKLKKPQAEKFKPVFSDLSELFEIIISLGNLRYRVKDYATFEVCEKEFLLVTKNLSNMLMLLAQKICGEAKINETSFNFKPYVQALEAIYSGALRVVSKEPIVFLIFMQNLNALETNLKTLAVDINSL